MTLFIVEAGTTEDLDSGRALPRIIRSWEEASESAVEYLIERLEDSETDEEVEEFGAALDRLSQSEVRFSAILDTFEVHITPVGTDPDLDFDDFDED